MKEIGMNEPFSVGGSMMQIIKIEKDEAVVQEIRTKKQYSYGIEALKRVGMQCGFNLKEGVGDAGVRIAKKCSTKI